MFSSTSATLLCGQTDSTGNTRPLFVANDSAIRRPFCYTAREVKFYETQVQRAKEYRTEIILLKKNAVSDSLQGFSLKGKITELEGKVVAMDTLRSVEIQKKTIVQGKLDRADRQKKGWKTAFIGSWAAIVGVFTYREIRQQ